MADENTPRDAKADEFLRKAKGLLGEFEGAARDITAAGAKIKADPAPKTPPGAPRSAPEVAKETAELERQAPIKKRMLGDDLTHLETLRKQAVELRNLTTLAETLQRRGLGLVSTGGGGREVHPTGRTPWMAGGAPITGDVRAIGRTFGEMKVAATEARDALLAEQSMRQRLASVGAVGGTGIVPQTGMLQVGGSGLILPAGYGAPQAPGPTGLIIPSVPTRSRQTTGERAEALNARDRAAAVAAGREELRQVGQMLQAYIGVYAEKKKGLAASIASARAAEQEAAATARTTREWSAAHPMLGPGERRQARLDWLGTAQGPGVGMGAVDQHGNYIGPGAPPSTRRRSPLPISYVNQGPEYEARAAEAEFGAHRGGRTAARDIAASTSELHRLGVVQAEASQQMRRHGALTTEFLTALARGETTVQEFGYHLGATAGKFAGWTAAAAGVYGLLGAFQRLKAGAQEGSSGIGQLDRVIDNLDPQAAQDAFTSLSREFNVPIETAVDAVYRMGQRFHQLPDAVEAARASLYSFKVGEVDVATSTQNLLAITRGFGLGADQMAAVFDRINAAQNEFGVRIPDTEAGLAKAAGAARNAGVDWKFLLGVMVAATQATGRPGTEVGTAIARGINESRKPINRDLLRDMGVDATDNFQTTLQSALKVAQQPGVDLNRLAKGLFGGQYARIIAPVLRDQRLLNQAIGPDFDKAAEGSAATELEKVLGQVDERLQQVGNSLERIGNALAQSGLLAPLSLMLDSLNGILHVTEGLLSAFSHLPAPIRAAAGAALGFMALRRVAGTNIGQGISEFTRIDALGPSAAQRSRREAIIGVRSSEQTAANQFEGAINQSAMLQSQANAERRLAQQLKLEADATTNDVRRTALRSQSIAAEERFNALSIQSAEMERLALGYQQQYVTAREARVALQKREVTAEAALAATSAANIIPAIGTARQGGVAGLIGEGSINAQHAEALAMNARHDAMLADRARMERERLSQVRPGGPIRGGLDKWARDNEVGRYPTRGPVLGANELVDLGMIDTRAVAAEANKTARTMSKSGVGRFGRQLGAAGKRFGGELASFAKGLGPIGIGFATLTVGQMFFDAVKGTQDKVAEAQAKNERAAHSVEDLQTQIDRSREDMKSGGQHTGKAYRILDNVLHPLGDTNARALDEADAASIRMREAIMHAREHTANSSVQNVGQTNKEILNAAQTDVNNITKLGLTREEFYANFERYAKNLGVSMEALITGKVDPKVQAALDDIKRKGQLALGPDQAHFDPFTQFRGQKPEDIVKYLGDIGNRNDIYGGSSEDADTIIRGIAYITQKYGHSNKPEDIEKVVEANAALDKLMETITNDLALALRDISRLGSDEHVPTVKAAKTALAGYGTQGVLSDRSIGKAIEELEREKAMITGSMGQANAEVMKAQDKLDALTGLRTAGGGERAAFALQHARARGVKGVVNTDAEIEMAIREQRRALAEAKKRWDESEVAKKKRLDKVQQKIDELEQQRFDSRAERISVTAAYQKSIASDESEQAAIDVDAAGRAVQNALQYHGPDRWKKILEALTAQNEAIAAQAQQNISDVQSTAELRTSGIIGAGREFDARRLNSELKGAQDVLAAAKAQKDWPGKKRAVQDAQKGVNGVLQQIAEFNADDAKKAEDLSRQLYESQQAIEMAGITDPVARQRKQLSIDRGILKRTKRSQFDSNIEYQIARNNQIAKTREDEIALRGGIIDDEYQTAQFEHEMGKLSDGAYIQELKRIAHMKGISKQMKRQLLLEIHKATEDPAGDLELNVGGIKLPSIYEIRRAMGGRSQRIGNNTTVHNNPTVYLSVANSSDLPATAEMLENVVGGPVKANLRAAGLI